MIAGIIPAPCYMSSTATCPQLAARNTGQTHDDRIAFLQHMIEDIRGSQPDAVIIVGGDMNAKVGNPQGLSTSAVSEM